MAKMFKVQSLIDSDTTVAVISHQLRVNQEMSKDGEVRVFDLAHVHPNIFNPREILFSRDDILKLSTYRDDTETIIRGFSEAKREQLSELVALAQNIEDSGLLQPIVVTDHPTIAGEFMVVAGERRYWSHILLERTVIRGIYRSVGEKSHRALSIAENLARNDLTLKEKVAGLRSLIAIDKSFYMVEHVIKLFGIKKTTAYQLLKAAKDETTFEKVMSGEILQFREIDNKNVAEVGRDNLPTVGKKEKPDRYMYLSRLQAQKLAVLMGIDGDTDNLSALLREKLS